MRKEVISRKAKVTDEHRAEARQLSVIWAATKHETQAIFGEKYNIGNQSAVGQFLRGESSLSIKAAQGFAKGLNCNVADFSPRLDAEIKKISTPHEIGASEISWQLSPALQEKISQLSLDDIFYLENTMRAHLKMPPLVQPDTSDRGNTESNQEKPLRRA